LYSHGFTPILFGQLGFEFEDYDFEQNNLTDNRAFSGTLGATYAVIESTTVGLSALGRYRDSRGLGDTQEETATDNYVGSIAASIAHQLTPTMSAFLQAGPSFIRSVPDDGSVDPETDLTFFATASVEKRWRTLDVSAAYTRTESGGSGAVSSQILDAVDLEATYRPYPDWRFRLLGRWSQQKVASTFQFVGGPVANDRELTRYRAVASVDYRFTDRLTAVGRFEYTHQKQDRQLGDNSTTQVAQGFVGIRYTFEPWVF
jgi:hypothetical protein